MGLTTSLNTAVAGLNATQIGIGVVSQNVANADRPGYIRRQVATVDSLSGNTVGTGSTAVQRLLDVIVQRQLWQETSGAAYTATRAGALSSLDQLYGAPGGATALDSVYNRFTGALQALQNDPSSYSLRTGVLDAATQLASRLNGLSDGVQALRSQAEAGIGNAVTQVNSLLNSLTSVNAKIVGAPNSGSTAELKDQRDRIVAELSQYIDIKTTEDARGSLSIVTNSGTQVFDGKPAITLSFDEHSNIGADSQWSLDPTQRGVGTIKLTNSGGNSVDAIANNIFRSGEIAAFVELRDTTLVQSQAQLDEIAAQMASALSDHPTTGTVSGTAPASQGDLALALNTLQRGNSVTLDYKTTPGGTNQHLTFVNVAAGTSLPASANGDTNNRVIGIDFSASPAAIQAQMQAAVGGPVASGGAFDITYDGTTLSIADDGALGARDVVGLSARSTSTTLGASGTPELPFFVDGGRGNAVFTGSYENGSQTAGFAGRIVVNPDLINARQNLVTYTPTTPQGDGARPQLMLERLTKSQFAISNATGIGGSNGTGSSTVSNLVQRVVSSQGQAVEQAKRLNEGQQVALAAVQSRFQETSKVNVDQEMSTLIELQTAYAANARIISTIKEMMDVLMRV